MDAGPRGGKEASAESQGLAMRLKGLFRSTNRRVRLLVGLMLVGLFGVHCTYSGADRTPGQFAIAIDGRQIGTSSGGVREKIEHLARTDHIALLEFCLERYDASYRDYTVTFLKQERIAGRVGKQQTVAVKFMEDPFSVGMKWVKNPPRGDRVLYVEGKYGNQMLVRPSGLIARKLVPTALRKPDGDDALKSTLRPVNLFGFKRGMQSLLRVYRQARQAGDLDQQFGGYADVAGRETIVLVRRLPNKPQCPAYLTKVYLDLDYLVPIMIEGTGWNEEFLCRYIYTDLKFNLGLTEEDFRPEAFDLRPQ